MVDTICYAGLWLIVIYVNYLFINLFGLLQAKTFFCRKTIPLDRIFLTTTTKRTVAVIKNLKASY